jgi:hypothetical protein
VKTTIKTGSRTRNIVIVAFITMFSAFCAPSRVSDIDYEVAAEYVKDGQQWKIAVVDRPMLSDGELVRLGALLRAEHPDTRVHIFGDGEQVDEYVEWTTSHPERPSPFPETWVKRHHLAIIDKSGTPEGSHWHLIAGVSHLEAPLTELAELP